MATEIIERKVYYIVKINFHHNWESKIVNLPGLNANLSEFFFFFFVQNWFCRRIFIKRVETQKDKSLQENVVI